MFHEKSDTIIYHICGNEFLGCQSSRKFKHVQIVNSDLFLAIQIHNADLFWSKHITSFIFQVNGQMLNFISKQLLIDIRVNFSPFLPNSPNLGVGQKIRPDWQIGGEGCQQKKKN
jgi:hypothetical protein